MKINEMGRFFDVDEAGYLVNAASRERICSPWNDAVESLIGACVSQLGKAVHSLYIRGSVAHGNAIVGVSDMDCFLLLARPATEADRAWRDEYVRAFPRMYSFATHLELPFRPLAHVLSAPERERTRFLLATQSACVYGRDIRPLLPKYRLDESIVFFARRLSSIIQRAQNGHLTADPAREKSNIGREILRAGAEIAMLQGHPFTRDLYPAFQLTLALLPQSKRDLESILAVAIGDGSVSVDWGAMERLAKQLAAHVPEQVRSGVGA